LTLRLDTDFWNARMAYLAKVARADAIAVILNLKGEGYATYVAHNLPTGTKWTDGLASEMLTKAITDRATEQTTSGVTVTLSDGRAADTLAVAPVVWKDQVVGGLAAMLVGRAFTPEDLAGLSRVGDLIGLELAARAGYDPQAGITLWQKMTQAAKGTPPTWLSTHPSGADRERRTKSALKEVMPLYEKAKASKPPAAATAN